MINIQVNSLYLENSSLLANGTNGIQGGGGGSGGSISLDFAAVQIATTPGTSVMITANGGSGKSSGGGGRIRYFYHNWNAISGNLGSSSLQVTANGGQCDGGKLSCGQSGSIIAAPCPPGYQLNYNNFGCSLCPNGTYQLTFSYDSCSECSIKPANSIYTWNQSSLADLGNYSTVCNFTCIDGICCCYLGFYLYNNRECLTKFNYMLADAGGINIIICLGIIVAAVVIFLIVLMVRKLSLSDKNIFDHL